MKLLFVEKLILQRKIPFVMNGIFILCYCIIELLVSDKTFLRSYLFNSE